MLASIATDLGTNSEDLTSAAVLIVVAIVAGACYCVYRITGADRNYPK